MRIGLSPNGYGVFSLRDFSVNEVLGPIEGQVIDDALYESAYCMELGENLVLEPAPPFCYVNHSCCPNCALIELTCDTEADAPRLWLKVCSDIVAGEELTIDYAWPAEAATPCRCGSPACRHWIVAADELDQVASRATNGAPP